MDFVVYRCIVWFRLSLEDQLDMNILVQLGASGGYRCRALLPEHLKNYFKLYHRIY